MLIYKVTSKWFRTDVQRKPSSGGPAGQGYLQQQCQSTAAYGPSCLLLLHHTCQVPRLLISNPHYEWRLLDHVSHTVSLQEAAALSSQLPQVCCFCFRFSTGKRLPQVWAFSWSHALSTVVPPQGLFPRHVSFLILSNGMTRDKRTLRNAGSAFLLLSAQFSVHHRSQDRQTEQGFPVMLCEKNLDFTARGSEWKSQKAAGSEVY